MRRLRRIDGSDPMISLLRSPRQGFAHGIHPPQFKDATRGLPIRQFAFAPLLVIPLSQHSGKPAKAVVREGQEVLRGQLLAEPDGFVSVAMHAPASGTVKKLDYAPSSSGRMVPAVYLAPFPGSSQEVSEGEPCDLESASADEILHAIQWAGIVGLGGAAFPTHVKLKPPPDKPIDTLIINGAECEPYLTTDHQVMLEQSADVFTGIRYLLRVCGAKQTFIGIEDNKPDAAQALRQAKPDDLEVAITELPVKYPQGAEKMLIQALLGRRVPSGGLPADVGVVTVNVATCAEIGRLLPHGRGIQERVVTITGPGVQHPGNYRIPIGTPLRFALEQVGAAEDLSQVFLGGPMMGPAVPSLDIPITKGSSGFVAYTGKQTGQRPAVYPCIHCGRCVEACPMSLNPCDLGRLARKDRFAEMSENHRLFDCFECGSCSFVCPSHLPLVQSFRVAKAALRKQARTPTGAAS